MSTWLIAIAAGLAVAAVQYGVRALRAGPMVLAAVLRIAAITVVTALILDAPIGRGVLPTTWTALDASLSMSRGAGDAWRAARDSIRRIAAESSFVFGVSVRRSDTASAPSDQASLLRPAVERAIGAGHP